LAAAKHDWCKSWLSFHEDGSLVDQSGHNAADAAHPPPEDEHERDPRCSMMQRCQLIDGHGRSFSCFLRNISRRGASARGCRGLRVGQKLMLILPIIGEVDVVVRWVGGDRFGLRLQDEIDPEMLMISGIELQPRFEPSFIHEPVGDFRRPGFTHRRL
jgi:hypothetical protein